MDKLQRKYYSVLVGIRLFALEDLATFIRRRGRQAAGKQQRDAEGRDAAARIDTIVQKMLTVMMNLGRLGDEGWFSWHMRPISATMLWLHNREGCRMPMVPQTSRPERSGLESLLPATRRHLDQVVVGLAERRSQRCLGEALRPCRSQ